MGGGHPLSFHRFLFLVSVKIDEKHVAGVLLMLVTGSYLDSRTYVQ